MPMIGVAFEGLTALEGLGGLGASLGEGLGGEGLAGMLGKGLNPLNLLESVVPGGGGGGGGGSPDQFDSGDIG